MAGEPLRRKRKVMTPVIFEAASHCPLVLSNRHIGCGYAEDFVKGRNIQYFSPCFIKVCEWLMRF